MRIKLLQEILNGKKKVYEVASLLSVSRQSVSKWLARYRIEWEAWVVPRRCWPKKNIPVNRTNQIVEEMIGNLARRYPELWPRSLSWKFQEETKISLDQSTVYRILSRTWVRYKRKWEWKQRRKTLYTLDQPGREIQLDVCFPFGRSRREVQYDAIDDCSRFVFSRVHSEQCVRSSMEFVLNLIDSSPFPIQTIRTDCWSEFGKWFTDFLVRLWIQHKRNAPYTPQHNGKVERYHRTLWQNLWEYSLRIDIHEYRYKLKLFTDYYNHQKPHSGLGMFGMTPAERIGYSLIQNSLAYAREFELSFDDVWGLKSFLNVNLTLQFNNLCISLEDTCHFSSAPYTLRAPIHWEWGIFISLLRFYEEFPQISHCPDSRRLCRSLDCWSLPFWAMRFIRYTEELERCLSASSDENNKTPGQGFYY
jgi:transposase InsO family protein